MGRDVDRISFGGEKEAELFSLSLRALPVAKSFRTLLRTRFDAWLLTFIPGTMDRQSTRNAECSRGLWRFEADTLAGGLARRVGSPARRASPPAKRFPILTAENCEARNAGKASGTRSLSNCGEDALPDAPPGLKTWLETGPTSRYQ